MPPITIRIPTQQELLSYQQDPNSLLAQYNAANAVKPTAGSGSAVTTAGNMGAGVPSNLNSLSNPDWIKSMSEMISQINIDAQQKANAARIPNATGLETKSSANIGSALAGEIPNDVYREMAQRSAERGVSTGSPMGANSTADIMRALGLTSLDLQNTGQTWLNNALARNPGATPANTQALVTTPLDAAKLALARENMMLEYNAAMAKIRADANNNRAGYGRGGGGSGGGSSGGGSFAPATNWNTGAPAITTPWNLGQTKDQYWGTTASSDWTPGTYTDTMNPLYGYTQTPGLPNTVPGGSPWEPQPLDTGGLDDILFGGNSQSYNDLTDDEWYALYGG